MLARWRQGRKLKKAGRIKESGNELFKQGKVADAWQCYKQALDLLYETSTPVGEPVKTKDALIQILHLNLAACELKLDNSDEVIGHCNKALEISNTSVKAYFRRGQAYQKQKKYSLAIKDYQIIVCVEPDNAIVRSHLDQCVQLLKDERKSEMSSLDCSDDMMDGNHEMEFGFENERELPARFRNCKKNPGHINFIPVMDFQMTHLPQKYHDKDLLDLIQQHVKSAVLLRVAGNSQHRPRKPYPFSGVRFRNTARVGSGWVNLVKRFMEADGLDCPCFQCQTSGELRKCWSKIEIWTAAHVVFDLTEGKKTTCYFDYDRDDIDLESCLSLTGAIQVESHVQSDTSRLTFITHDTHWADKLYDTFWQSKLLCSRVKEKFNVASDNEEEGDLYQKTCRLYDRLCLIRSLLHKQKEKFTAISDGNIHQQWGKYLTKPVCAVSNSQSLLNMLILDEVREGGSCTKIVTALTEAYERTGALLTDLGELLNRGSSLMASEEGKRELLDVYSLSLIIVNAKEREVQVYANVFRDDDDDDDGYHLPQPQFLSAHPLTVVISHPHGCSKKITIGEIVERKEEIMGTSSQYRYTNSTCPGSSGARIFILGRTGILFDLPHSGTYGGCINIHHINESAVGADI